MSQVLAGFANVIDTKIVPDEIPAIQAAIKEAVEKKVDLVLTSGGTGFAPRDVTPEATLPLITKRADSLTEYMLREAGKITPMAALSRCLIGVIVTETNSTMVINLPGKPKAVKENFEILQRKGVLGHALSQMKS